VNGILANRWARQTVGKCRDVSWWATSRFNLIEELAVAAQHRVGFVMVTEKAKLVIDMNFISPLVSLSSTVRRGMRMCPGPPSPSGAPWFLEDANAGCGHDEYSRRAFIHSADIAAVAAKALMTPEYEGQSLPISGPETMSFAEVAARIGVAIGKRVIFRWISDEGARQRFAATGASETETEAHVALCRAIREDRLGAITDIVERVLNRKPLSLDQWE
jgi:hypothetical protein